MTSSLNIINEMEGVFLKFDSYKFEADQRFLDGLQKTNRSTEDKLLDMKLFFYNRFIEPIDQRAYKRWRSSLPKMDDRSEQLNQEVLPDTDSVVSKSQRDETSADTETHRLSFEEVMRLVQEGKHVPGVTKLDIQPSNQNPTPSQMERKTKPWEISPMSS